MIIPTRRAFLTGLGSAIAAPAIVRYGNIMPVRAIVMPSAPGAGWARDVFLEIATDPLASMMAALYRESSGRLMSVVMDSSGAVQFISAAPLTASPPSPA